MTVCISGCGIAENGFESIVGRQSSIPGLFPGMSAETILNSNFSIVEDDSPGDTAEVLEYLDQGIQKAFFILPSVCQNQRCTAVSVRRLSVRLIRRNNEVFHRHTLDKTGRDGYNMCKLMS